MHRTIKVLALTGVFAAAASVAGAAPSNIGQMPEGVSNGVVQVHGNHRSCERGPGGWHRHNQFGERRPCREWHGRGRRPDACVKFGPVWYCDY
jgi:hypothetical protein